MVRVEINSGAAVLDLDYTAGMTVQDLIAKIQDHKPGRHVRFNDIQLYDPSQNSHLALSDEIVDDRYYFATAWVQTVTDESGNPLRSNNLQNNKI